MPALASKSHLPAIFRDLQANDRSSSTLIHLHADLDYAMEGTTYRVHRTGQREFRLENVKRLSATYVRDWQLAQASFSVVEA